MSFPHLPIAHIFALKKQDMSDFSFIPPTSVVTIPGAHASAAFTSKTSEVFKEEHNIAPIIINDKMQYIPWGPTTRYPTTSSTTPSTAPLTNPPTHAIHPHFHIKKNTHIPRTHRHPPLDSLHLPQI